MRRDDLAAFHLLVDQLLQRGVIMVFELIRLELAGLAFDELDSEVHHLLVRLLVRHVLEEGLGLAQLVGVAQHHHAETIWIDRHDRDQPFATRYCDLAETNLARLPQGFADDDVALGPVLVANAEIVGPLKVAQINVLSVDEADEVDGLLGLELEGVDLLGLERDVWSTS